MVMHRNNYVCYQLRKICQFSVGSHVHKQSVVWFKIRILLFRRPIWVFSHRSHFTVNLNSNLPISETSTCFSLRVNHSFEVIALQNMATRFALLKPFSGEIDLWVNNARWFYGKKKRKLLKEESVFNWK